ncbi:MAG: HlyD family efflux transporter periplasmic adaptor subunit [Nitrospira sp.]|nr:HlyD family efflux transporter periplasmic adaptor subunit [Nitrospira sp.]MDE0404535.1 HlyD family efflux transporter periplasmic adaptor subunit [Nitrospira sp.]MDE0486247.1 HlyD family efflux transporter periplasmic adaptor subunit [Nitrospira sp.]
MFGSPFLQEAANNRNKRQQLDHLLRVTAPHERMILAGIGLVMLALVAWVLFGSIVRSVTIDGVLIEPGVRHEIISTEPGYLVEFLVVPGDHVEAGDPIARQSVPELDSETAALRNRIEMLKRESRQVGGEGSGVRSLLTAAQVALVQIEARRSSRELIVSPVAGEVTALRSAPGEYLSAGGGVAQLREAEDQPLQAVLRVSPRTAQRIRPGMRASVEVMIPDGVKRRLDAEVTLVTPGPLPNWLASLEPAILDSAHRVDVVLRQASDLSLPDVTPCRVRIVLGQQPLTVFLGFGRF